MPYCIQVLSPQGEESYQPITNFSSSGKISRRSLRVYQNGFGCSGHAELQTEHLSPRCLSLLVTSDFVLGTSPLSISPELWPVSARWMHESRAGRLTTISLCESVEEGKSMRKTGKSSVKVHFGFVCRSTSQGSISSASANPISPTNACERRLCVLPSTK